MLFTNLIRVKTTESSSETGPAWVNGGVYDTAKLVDQGLNGTLYSLCPNTSAVVRLLCCGLFMCFRDNGVVY